MKRTDLILFLMLAIGVTGCSIAPEAKRPVNIYDFGLASPPAKSDAHIMVQEITAPPWLGTPALQYRLLFHDAARLNAYADSRWAAPPAALLTLRMRQGLALHTPDSQAYQLRMELEEFSQVFDSAESSRGLVRIRATLMQVGEHKAVASRTFSLDRKADSPNAEGGVHALNAASDELIAKVNAWLNETVAEQARKK